jgi:Holliday junction resolvase
VTLDPPRRSSPQNAALHAALTDIAEQVEWKGLRFDVLTWKRLCTASWLREHGEQPELIPALDGKGFDIIYEPTSKMSKQQLSDLLEWVHKFGAENGVQFKGDGR